MHYLERSEIQLSEDAMPASADATEIVLHNILSPEAIATFWMQKSRFMVVATAPMVSVNESVILSHTS